MNVHKNARLTPLGRERIVALARSGLTPKAISQTAGVSPRTVSKWIARCAAEGLAGLVDRSSRPRHMRKPTHCVETGSRQEGRRCSINGRSSSWPRRDPSTTKRRLSFSTRPTVRWPKPLRSQDPRRRLRDGARPAARYAQPLPAVAAARKPIATNPPIQRCSSW